MNRQKLAFIILAEFLYCYLLIGLDINLGFHLGLNRIDEGFSAYGAQRILNGEIPYKDFWTIYLPAHYYFLALVFKIFGTTLWVERVWSILGQFLMSVMVYFL